jgi:Na+-transporting methylmalonyl-CoA/oxaloacetate decarboxylase gamma subunit
MKIFLFFLVLLLTACMATPVKRTFPDVPEDLKTACPDLIIHQSTTKLSEVVSVVAANYDRYEECQIKVDTWNEWYKQQKEIFESVK